MRAIGAVLTIWGLLAFVGTSALAQESGETFGSYEPNRKSIALTPVAGFSSFGLEGSGVADEFGTDHGLNGGVLVDIGTSATVFQTGLVYNQLGAKGDFEGEQALDRSTLTLNLDYLQVPVVAKHVTANGWYFKGGAVLGYLLDAEWESVSRGKTRSVKRREGIKDFDFLGQLGVGYIFGGDKVKWLGEASFNRSLDTISEDGNAYNQGFIVSVGVQL